MYRTLTTALALLAALTTGCGSPTAHDDSGDTGGESVPEMSTQACELRCNAEQSYCFDVQTMSACDRILIDAFNGESDICTEKDVENGTITGGGLYYETCITLRG